MKSPREPLDRERLLRGIRSELLHSAYAQPGWVAIESSVALIDRLEPDRPLSLEGGDRSVRARLELALAAHEGVVFPRDLRTGDPIRFSNGDLIAMGPGHQILYRTPPFHDPARLIARWRLIFGGLLHRLPEHGFDPVLSGVHPHRQGLDLASELHAGPIAERQRQLGAAGLALRGHQGLSLILNNEPGPIGHRRLVAAARLAPYMAALFAHAPAERDGRRVAVSQRIAEWQASGHPRVRPLAFHLAEDPAETVLHRALATPFSPRDATVHPERAPSFGAWLKEPALFRREATIEDWRAHWAAFALPVAPHGAIEIAVHDQLRMHLAPVPPLIWWALLWRGDLLRWCELPELDLKTVALRGARVPGVVVRGHEIFDAAEAALSTSDDPIIPAELMRLVQEFRARYLDQGRVPADDAAERNLDRLDAGA